MDLSQFMGLLPMMIAVLTPIIVQMLKKVMVQFFDEIPKVFIPPLAAVVGAIGEVLATGNVTQIGPIAGLASTGLRDTIHNAKG